MNSALANVSVSLNFAQGITILLCAIVAGLYIRFLYIKFSLTYSSKISMGNTLLMVTISVASIIAVVKASLALSLGLVGALSIIRFRNAIKEPEELTYLFIAISIGLGIGANQLLITLIAFLVIIGVIVFKHKRSDKKHINTNLQLILHIKNKNNLPVEKVLEIFNLFFEYIFLQRLEEKDQELEISLLIEAESFSKINEAKKLLQENDENVHITFMQNEYI